MCNTLPETPTGVNVLQDILDRKLDCIDFPFTFSLLNLEMHVLYLMITHIFLSRYDSHTLFSIFDALMMFNIKHCICLDLRFMMLIHIYFSSSHDTKTILPCRMYLTRVF